MNTWLETVPVLLARLGVKHVAIVTHSAGTIYTLNTLTHYRSILHPENPYVAFLGLYHPSEQSEMNKAHQDTSAMGPNPSLRSQTRHRSLQPPDWRDELLVRPK